MYFETPTVGNKTYLLQFKSKPLLQQKPLFKQKLSNETKAFNPQEPQHKPKRFFMHPAVKKQSKMSKQKRKRLNRLKRIRLAKAIVFHQQNSGQKLTKTTVDYKNIPLLRRYISFEGKILKRRISRLTAKKQRKITTAIKTARVAGMLPFIRH